MTTPTPLRHLIALQAAAWSGVHQPNDAAGAMADMMESSVKGLAALRGELAFEEEPSSFEAALRDTMESAEGESL